MLFRIAVTLGGDCDKLICIAGSMTEAFYFVSENLKEEYRKRMISERFEILDKFD